LVDSISAPFVYLRFVVASSRKSAIKMNQLVPPAIVQGFDYTALDRELAAKCRAAAGRIKNRLSASAIDTGNDLIAIKTKIPHGSFGAAEIHCRAAGDRGQ
jgi:hypothetical protein